MNEAIKLAIEKGGYQLSPKEWGDSPVIEQNYKWGNPPPVGLNPNVFWVKNGITGRKVKYHFAEVILDSLFWQALGKALGWNWAEKSDLINLTSDKRIKMGNRWQWEAVRFMHIKLTGGNEEKFFEELLR